MVRDLIHNFLYSSLLFLAYVIKNLRIVHPKGGHHANDLLVELSPEEEERALVLAEQLMSSVLSKGQGSDGRQITPFKVYLNENLQALDGLSRAEIVEGFLKALESTAEEINFLLNVPIECSIERQDFSTYWILHGHLSLHLDTATPDLYDISIDLLKDGFTFMADSKTFMVSSRINK